MTYRELIQQLQTLNEEQMDREVILYNFEKDLLLDNIVTRVGVAQYDAPGLISKGTPYVVFWVTV